jgi:hypothetical protein
MTINIASAGADAAALKAALSASLNTYERVVNVTASQLHAANTSPITLVPAPGVGKVLIVERISGVLKLGTYPYTYTSGAPQYMIGTGNLGAPTFIRQLQDTVESSRPGDVSTNTSSMENLPLLLKGVNYDGASIASSSLASGGSGYAPGDTGYIDPDIDSAPYTVDTVDGGGAVLTYHIDGGGGYSVASNVATTADQSGTGFRVNILSVAPGDGTVRVTVRYSILDVGA